MVFTRESGIVSPMPLRVSVAWDPLRVSRLFLTVLSHLLYPPLSLGYNQPLREAGLVRRQSVRA
jgi:hypothetical protein